MTKVINLLFSKGKLIPLFIIFIIVSIILIIIPYFNIDQGKWNFIVSTKTHFITIIGIVILFFLVVLFIALIIKNVFTLGVRSIKGKKVLKLKYKFGPTILEFIEGKIQEIVPISNSAFILPVNNTFIDDCIDDEKSATGNFFKHHFIKNFNKKDELQQAILKELTGIKKTDIYYPEGTTLILPEEYNIEDDCKCIITASAIRSKTTGIISTPGSIYKSINNVYLKTKNLKIETLYMPVIGSGHGGLEFTDSLLCLIMIIKDLSKRNHHIKNVKIVIRKEDYNKINKFNIYSSFTNL